MKLFKDAINSSQTYPLYQIPN